MREEYVSIVTYSGRFSREQIHEKEESFIFQSLTTNICVVGRTVGCGMRDVGRKTWDVGCRMWDVGWDARSRFGVWCSCCLHRAAGA